MAISRPNGMDWILIGSFQRLAGQEEPLRAQEFCTMLCPTEK
jgi:hypothetical protein